MAQQLASIGGVHLFRSFGGGILSLAGRAVMQMLKAGENPAVRGSETSILLATRLKVLFVRFARAVIGKGGGLATLTESD